MDDESEATRYLAMRDETEQVRILNDHDLKMYAMNDFGFGNDQP